ncbi:uncharacterized protein A4U43_C08F4350 [Asparagus officinalis]|nr:uncharacterized protein A4U43_C08F4350 [Asparagus officinalis]
MPVRAQSAPCLALISILEMGRELNFWLDVWIHDFTLASWFPELLHLASSPLAPAKSQMRRNDQGAGRSKEGSAFSCTDRDADHDAVNPRGGTGAAAVMNIAEVDESVNDVEATANA